MDYLVFDIETRPLSDEQLLHQWGEFVSEAECPGEFDPSSVKLGRLVKQDAIDKKIEEARAKHAESVASYHEEVASGPARHLQSIRSKATLHSESGQILTIGVKWRDEYRIPEGSEKEQLENWWKIFEYHQDRGNMVIGFNCKEFDMPWLVNRSWINDVKIPAAVIDKDRFWNPCIVDLMAKWACGAYGPIHRPSLNRLSKAFGLQGKDKSGALLYELWDTDRAAAIEYVKGDLDLTEGVARRMLRL